MDEDITRQITRKAMAFDLFNIIDSDATKGTYTKDEIKPLFGSILIHPIRNK